MRAGYRCRVLAYIAGAACKTTPQSRTDEIGVLPAHIMACDPICGRPCPVCPDFPYDGVCPDFPVW